MPKILSIIKNHVKSINLIWNCVFLENLSFLAWKLRVFKIWLYKPWAQIKILHFSISWTREWLNQLETEVQSWSFEPHWLIEGANDTKVNIRYQEPKDVAPFHLLLIFESPNGFEMWKMTSICIQINANIIYKHLKKYLDPLFL